MDSGNYIFGANQRISLSYCPDFPASYPPMFLSGVSSTQDLGPRKPFFLSGSTFKPSQNHLGQTIITPHPPPTYHFSLNQHKNISSWRIDSLSPSSPSRTRCACLLGICSPSRQRKHTHQLRPRYVTHAASTHSHPQLTNGVP